MSYARPRSEDDFVNRYLAKYVHALGVSEDLQAKFLKFAVTKGNADERKLRARLYHIVKGRTPSAYLALLILRFFQERHYEDFQRTTKNYIEYITSDGETADLETLVNDHPMMLRIARVRMTNWAMTGKPNRVDIHLRSPIENPEDWDAKDKEMDLDALNAQLFRFQQWLANQAELPKSFRVKSGEMIPISHQPEWLRYSDEVGFETDSDLEGDVDMTHGVSILVYAELGPNSPQIPPGLDVFYHLSDLFVGTEAKPAPRERSFENYWPRIVTAQSDFSEIFFSRIDQFPSNVRRMLEPFFKNFAQVHSSWVKKAFADLEERGGYGDHYIPKPEDVAHYNRVKALFFEELKPVLQRCWTSFAEAALKIHERERVRAREHWEKMRKHFKS